MTIVWILTGEPPIKSDERKWGENLGENETMGVLPVAGSRVTEPLKTARLVSQLNADQLAIQRAFDQLSSGRRVTKVSDDPAAAGRAIILQRGISRGEQLSRNAGVTESFYAATDGALQRLDQSLIEARGVTVEAGQNVLSTDERNALAQTIRGTLNSAIAAGNAIFRDQQLMGGVLENTPALTFDGRDVMFRGTDAVAKTNVGSGGLVNVGVSGLEAMGLAGTIHQGPSLNAGLDRSTRLIDMRDGLGVKPGLIRISDGGNFVDVDLRAASTLGDVVDVIESIDFAGRRLRMTVQPDGVALDFADGLPGTLAIADPPGESMAKELSLLNPLGLTAPPLVATRLAPRVTEATLLSRVNGGAGINVTSGIVIQQAEASFTVNLAEARTVGDVLIAINRSGADVLAELDTASGGITIRGLRNGVDYSIGENGGSAARRLGLRTADGSTALSKLDRGRGLVLNNDGPDLSIIRPDGVELAIDLNGATTIEDVMIRIRNHPMNQDTLRVQPSLNPVGNGIQLLAPPGANRLVVRASSSGNAAHALGLVPPGQMESQSSTVGAFEIFRGSDYKPLEPGGAVDTLIRLETAVRSGDIKEISRLQGLLDVDLDRSNNTRGRVGVWTQNVQQLKESADDQVIALKSELSTEIDTDFASVITELQQRQATVEASLRLIGQTAQLSLLDFL